MVLGTLVVLVLLWLLGAGLDNTGLPWVRREWGRSAGQRELESEIPVCEYVKAENWYSWRRCVAVEFSVFAKAQEDGNKQLADLVDKHRSQLTDDIRAVVAGVEPEALRDPELVLVKHEVQDCLDDVVGKGLVAEVLVPVWHAQRVQ